MRILIAFFCYQSVDEAFILEIITFFDDNKQIFYGGIKGDQGATGEAAAELGSTGEKGEVGPPAADGKDGMHGIPGMPGPSGNKVCYVFHAIADIVFLHHLRS